MAEEGWFSKFVHVVRSVSKEEVKTPLSFFFRAALVLPVLVVPIIAASVPAEIKYEVVRFGLAGLLLLTVLVAVFAWFKPKNLVYGESGHRAEFKMEYGTEKGVLTHREVVTLRGEQNPKALPEKAEKAAEENA